MNVKKLSYKKGQAVMEYLITYGLALVVILIVLAILVSVVLPALKAPDTCQFTQPGFSCNTKQHALVADSNSNVKLLVQIDNQQGKGIVLQKVLCTATPPGNIIKSFVEQKGVSVESSSGTLVSGGSVTIGSSSSKINKELPCYAEDGTQLVMPANSNFKGSFVIEYKFSEDVPGAPSRIAVATLTGVVQSS